MTSIIIEITVFVLVAAISLVASSLVNRELDVESLRSQPTWFLFLYRYVIYITIAVVAAHIFWQASTVEDANDLTMYPWIFGYACYALTHVLMATVCTPMIHQVVRKAIGLRPIVGDRVIYEAQVRGVLEVLNEPDGEVSYHLYEPGCGPIHKGFLLVKVPDVNLGHPTFRQLLLL